MNRVHTQMLAVGPTQRIGVAACGRERAELPSCSS